MQPPDAVTLGRPRLRLTDEAVALTRRGHTTTIRFADVTSAGAEQAAVSIAAFGRAADTRQFRIQSATAIILVEGRLADAAGEDFEAAWLSISRAPRACSGAVYPGVPMSTPVRVIAEAAAARAMPKSPGRSSSR